MNKEETETLDRIAELINLIRFDKKILKELEKWLKQKVKLK